MNRYMQKHQQTTDQELKFLDRIGTFAENPKPKEQLLRGYLKAAELRTDWGLTDKWVAIQHAKKLLRNC